MIDHLYQNTILKNPKSILIILLIGLISFGYYSKDFRLDASSETLLIEGDPDLEYLKEITNRYGSKDFLVLTHTPNDGMVTDSAINNLLSLKYKLQSLDWIHSVVIRIEPDFGVRSQTIPSSVVTKLFPLCSIHISDATYKERDQWHPESCISWR